MTPLIPEPLTVAAFAPFGDVLEDTDARMKWINDRTTRRFDCLTEIVAGGGGRAAISLFRASPRPPEIAMLECHPLGSQAFMPAGGGVWLVAVAPGDGEKPEWEKLRCFLAGGGQGVNYRPGAWHHPILVLEERDFWVADRAPPPGESTDANLREFYCPPQMRACLEMRPAR
ncbi:MAG: ureidoglycolate lyase [Gammaproteobacteria bacterium]